MSTTSWNDLGGYADQSLNPSTPNGFDPIEASYGPTPLALQQQQLHQQQQQQQQQHQDAYNAAFYPQSSHHHLQQQHDHDSVHSPMTAYSGSAMDPNMMDYGSPFAATMGGGGSIDPAATVEMDYDLSGIAGVVGGPTSMRSQSMMDIGGPSRSVSMSGLEQRGMRPSWGTTSASEAFARLKGSSLSITPSSATTKPKLSSSAKDNGGGSGQGAIITNGVPRMARPSINDLPMRAFSYPARLPMASQVSPRKSFSASSNNSHQMQSPVSSPFPAYESNPPYRSSNPTYDMYGTSANTAHSLNEGGLSAFSDGIVPSNTTTPTLETYQQQDSNKYRPSEVEYPHQTPIQPQPPPASGPTMAPPSVYASSGFDLVGVLARVVGRQNPVINVGAIDMSCSFIVADARAPDTPSIYVSETFCRLTGYSRDEIVGRSCRFLQAPGDQQVRKGEKRRYTDGSAANHLRVNIDALQECQVSLINYQKGGKPFINLVTCIPISWNNTGEIDFIVGFQVDLVDQPAAILDKMQNGSYVVNYSAVHATIARNPSVSSADIASAIEQLEDTALQNAAAASAHAQSPYAKVDSSNSIQTLRDQVATSEPGEVIDMVAQHGLAGLPNEVVRKQFMRLMVDQCDDLVHVLSLKGALLYVSPAARKLLEYEPSELLGKTLASFCHPSDIVSVQRELKDAGMASQASVNLVYRIRRKNSGYMWFEASGRLHLEQGKGRKCVILTGRPREVYKMSWQDLERAGGMGESEFWGKVCVDGIFLTATRTTDNVFGVDSQKAVVGRSFADLSPKGQDVSGVMQALIKAAEGTPSQVQHQMLGRNGPIDVVTHFYPARTDNEEPTSPTLPAVGQKQVSVIAQVNLLSSEMNKRHSLLTPKTRRSGSTSDASNVATGGSVSSAGGPVALALPAFAGHSVGAAHSTTSARSSFSAVPSTFKSLASPDSQSDNVFDELNVTRGTSWQFELHQMRLTNKKLREEKEALSALKRKREQTAKSASSAKGGSGQRACANCGRTSSAEWRSGPTGPKTLCNACGLRWSKARSQATAADVKKKAESAVATQVQHTSTKLNTNVGSGSDESRGASGSRESSSGTVASTNPTTNSPGGPPTYDKQFQMQQPPQVFAPAYTDSLAPSMPPPPPHFGFSRHPTH